MQGDWTTGSHPGFGYDALDRLTEWRIGGVTQETFGYDAIGNLTNKSSVGNYNYAAWGGCPGRPMTVMTAGGYGYCYDGNGNNTWRYEGGKLYWQTWNHDNKLVQVDEYSPADWTTHLGTRAAYSYDADGRRVRA